MVAIQEMDFSDVFDLEPVWIELLEVLLSQNSF